MEAIVHRANLHMVRDLKIRLIFISWTHIYVAKCKWKSLNKMDSDPISKNAWSEQV